MKTTISPKAEKQFRKLPKIDQIAITQKIRSLKNVSTTNIEEKLKGFKKTFRIRMGNYRVVYARKTNEIYVILIAHRKEIYLLLKQLFST